MAITLGILMFNWTLAQLDGDFSQGDLVPKMLFLDLGINNFLVFIFIFVNQASAECQLL